MLKIKTIAFFHSIPCVCPVITLQSLKRADQPQCRRTCDNRKYKFSATVVNPSCKEAFTEAYLQTTFCFISDLMIYWTFWYKWYWSKKIEGKWISEVDFLTVETVLKLVPVPLKSHHSLVCKKLCVRDFGKVLWKKSLVECFILVTL